MNFQIKIECSTVALGGDSISRSQELANILIAVAADLLDQGLVPGDKRPLRDRNGHSVGTARLTNQPHVLASSPFLNRAFRDAREIRHSNPE
ncbi:hypothetical protein IYW40_15500 [Methylocystis sp. H4A]|uniref:hypothetical protein n=1 Tax=Methylocystis sp. H4A TaxID=2785788 RepID=UPI0018C2259B|nr:hypothetical protein [Methylocystis sp. H4A]MBG0802872.1 hypothetical protein [Methylocystis sp. H4A]